MEGKKENDTVCVSFISGLDEELREKWENFVSGTLSETNKQNTVDLVSLF